jgi:hypothetical protein
VICKVHALIIFVDEKRKNMDENVFRLINEKKNCSSLNWIMASLSACPCFSVLALELLLSLVVGPKNMEKPSMPWYQCTRASYYG